MGCNIGPTSVRDRLLIFSTPLIVVFLMTQDRHLLRTVQAFNPPGWKTFMQGFTLSADFFVLLSLAGLCWVVPQWPRHGGAKKKEALLRWGEWGGCSLIASRVVVGAVKMIVGRGRPSAVDIIDPLVFIGPTLQLPFHSFPSAHTSSAFSVAAVVSTLFPPLRTPVLCWAVGIGLSRVVLNEHFVSDVVAGGLLGYGITLIVMKIIGRREGT
jgi:membrane-associated phospholipid phosphatase